MKFMSVIRMDNSYIIKLFLAFVLGAVQGWRQSCTGSYYCLDSFLPGGHGFAGFRPFSTGFMAPPAPSIGGYFSQGSCLDIHGNLMAIGQVYFDGRGMRTCMKDSRMEFMKQKWRTLFKIFDFDRDQTITRKDFEILKTNFIRAYKLQGSVGADYMAKQLDKFLHCIILDGLRMAQKLTEDAFIAIHKKAFIKQRAATIKRVRACNEFLLNVVDQDKDGFITFMELFQDFSAWNQSNKKLVQAIFQLMGPNKKFLLPAENFNNFYIEFQMGTNMKAFEKIKMAYANAGIFM